MKICLVTRRFSQTWGGAERVAATLARRLKEKGHEVHVVASASDAPGEGTALTLIKADSLFPPCNIFSFQRKVKRYLEGAGFDLVYGLCRVYPLDIYRLSDGIHRHWMKVQYPNPAVRVMKYLTSLVHLAVRWFEGRIFREGNCRFFVTNSLLVKEQIMHYFPVPGERIQVIYNGVDHDLFNPGMKAQRNAMRERCGIASDEMVVLHVSNNWERKGLETVIEAMSKAGSGNLRLVIVGRGKKSRYLSLACNRGLGPERLIFAGHTGDVAAYYGMADLFVLPSRYEPFSNACLEAMACGLPVVTTKTNGASELIDEGCNGFVLGDWRDAAALSEIINEMQDCQRRETMGRSAALTAQNYTWDRHIDETGRLFELLMKKGDFRERTDS